MGRFCETYNNRESLIPATQTEDEVAGLADVDAVSDLVVEEGETLKQAARENITSNCKHAGTFSFVSLSVCILW